MMDTQLSLFSEDVQRNLRRPEFNPIKLTDRAAHDWYRFVQSHPPQFVRDQITKLDLEPDQCLLDPYCGAGTTVVEAKKLGLRSIGIEANVMAWFAGCTKLDWQPDPDKFLRQAESIAAAAQAEIARIPLDLAQIELPEPPSALRTLPQEAFGLLLKNSISPLPLHKALILRDQIEQQTDEPYRNHYKVAFAKILVADVSNLHFRPKVGVSAKKKLDSPVVDHWLDRVKVMAEDLHLLQALPQPASQIHHGDACSTMHLLQAGSIDAVITCPPYPSEQDSTRTMRLELVMLGFLLNKADLRDLKQTLMRSNMRLDMCDQDDQWITKHIEIQRLAAEIEGRHLELGKNNSRRYSDAFKLFFGGMAKHLADLRPVLRPGARLVYGVSDQQAYLGLKIRTGELLATIAQGLGYDVDRIERLHPKMAIATQIMPEEIVVLRWPGKFPTLAYPFSDLPP